MRKIDIDKFREFAQKHVYWWGKERPNIDVLGVSPTICVNPISSHRYII